jgi:hypothetical protein
MKMATTQKGLQVKIKPGESVESREMPHTVWSGRTA